MSTTYVDTEPALPTKEETDLARESIRRLGSHVGRELQIAVCDQTGETARLELPRVAVELLRRLLAEIARGNAVTIIPYHAELTTQQAANVLHVSRPFLVRLLDRGELPHHRVGTHRRIRFEDVMAYKKSLREKQREALDALTRDAQELDLGY